ncbi:MAG: DUF2723 domain-containing protein [Leptospiraceae bacterium]|nr:DUF2723 domain-containing protein [Leptospiraceae bacterium]
MSKLKSRLNEFFLANYISYPLIFGISFLFYLYCVCPGIGFGDTAILIDNIKRGILNTEVNTHPLTILIGKLFLSLPGDNIAYQANLLSAFSGALALGIFLNAVQEYHENLFVSFLSTIALAVSYSFFWHSTIVENYNISSIITALSLLFYVRIEKRKEEKWFYPLFALFGIGIFNHMQMGFLGMGIGVQFLLHFFKVKNRLSFFLKCSAGFIIGLIPWTTLLINDISHNGDFTLVIKNAFMGSFGGVFFNQTWIVALQEFIIIYLFQFPNLFFIFPLIGLVFVVKNKSSLLAFSGSLIHFFTNTYFFAFYGTWDKFAFLLQSFILFVFYGSFFLQSFQSRKRIIVIILNVSILVSVFWGTQFYEAVELSAQNPSGFWYPRYNNNYSLNLYNQARYVIVPNKRDYKEVENYCELLFAKLPEGSTMLEDDSRTYYPLADYFQKYYNRRKDIHFLLMNSWGIAGWGLSSEQVAKEIKMSVEKGIPFFLPSLSVPYGPIIDSISKDNTMFIEKYPLSDTQWIYQVKTRSVVINETKNEKNLWDLKIENITAKSTNVLLERQLMYNFIPDTWDSSDQIFASGEVGSYVEFNLKYPQIETKLLQFNFTTAPDFGLINVRWNNKSIFEGLDLYSPSVRRLSKTISDVNIQKENILRIEIAGKNKNSSGFKFGIDSLKANDK